MRASLLLLGVLVWIVCLGNENGAVYASPVPDPCNYFLRQFQPSTTTPPPKTEEKLEEAKREWIKQYKPILEEVLFGNKYTKESKVEVKETEPVKPKTYDMNSFFSAYMEFWTKFFNMF